MVVHARIDVCRVGRREPIRALARVELPQRPTPSASRTVTPTTKVELGVALTPGRATAAGHTRPWLREAVLLVVPAPGRRDRHVSVRHVRIVHEDGQRCLPVNFGMVPQGDNKFDVGKLDHAAHRAHHVAEERDAVIDVLTHAQHAADGRDVDPRDGVRTRGAVHGAPEGHVEHRCTDVPFMPWREIFVDQRSPKRAVIPPSRRRRDASAAAETAAADWALAAAAPRKRRRRGPQRALLSAAWRGLGVARGGWIPSHVATSGMAEWWRAGL